MRSRHRLTSLALSALLLAVLIYIALYVRDDFVRPVLGDVLAAAWVYVTARAVTPQVTALVLTLTISYALEFAQYFKLIDVLGLTHSTLAKTLLGATFDPLDLLAYTIGASVCFGLDWAARDRFQNPRA